jgi:hypothetical protein
MYTEVDTFLGIYHHFIENILKVRSDTVITKRYRAKGKGIAPEYASTEGKEHNVRPTY